jgi:hypothetical protein
MGLEETNKRKIVSKLNDKKTSCKICFFYFIFFIIYLFLCYFILVSKQELEEIYDAVVSVSSATDLNVDVIQFQYLLKHELEKVS